MPDRLPACTHHGPMRLRPSGGTREQQYCGVWYDCRANHCRRSVLIASPALLADLAQQAAAARPAHHPPREQSSSFTSAFGGTRS
ncbi:hypothetical protein LN042_23055 [Kitasatospora sp. RB6PN24]|uniref:hypothetical protein n=1 Tax=Kitasatospora humi TaxID=2893891 RepID=UPI001E569CD6|nr:hypothetical protein [Kitasatospora humi]MCC9309915.1 hypothetical protein [Kitasatospora humi]